MWDEKCTHTLIAGKLDGNEPLVKPIIRWEDDV
jgi:hypothetical protein